MMLRAETVEQRHAETRTWRSDALDAHLVSLIAPASFEADQYRMLRHLVERLHAPRHLIAVTSAGAGDGKTTTAINLAAVLAHAPNTGVLVMDLDLRTPAVAQRLGLPRPARGLVDLLLEPARTLDDVVWRHPAIPLSVLPAGRSVPAPYELFQSPRLHTLMSQLRQQYDCVILDAPPVALVPESRLIADQVDGFLMVVAAHRTPRSLLEEALNAMDPGKVIGIVFNGDDRLLSGYYRRYDGGYGHGRRGGRGRGQPAI